MYLSPVPEKLVLQYSLFEYLFIYLCFFVWGEGIKMIQWYKRLVIWVFPFARVQFGQFTSNFLLFSNVLLYEVLLWSCLRQEFTGIFLTRKLVTLENPLAQINKLKLVGISPASTSFLPTLHPCSTSLFSFLPSSESGSAAAPLASYISGGGGWVVGLRLRIQPF